MVTLATNVITYADWAKRLDPGGNIDTLVELLSKTNPIVEDAAVVEGNLPTGHKTTVRSGLPTPTWRKLNYGVQPDKSTSVQVTDECGMLEAYSEVDKDLADLNGNTAEFRLSEDKGHLESMNQEVASTLFYGNQTSTPSKFTGLAPRYSSLSAENGEKIVDAGGSGSDNTSIWIITWGPDTCHMIFPKGKKAGLHHEDKGQETLEDANGGLYEGYRTHYKWDVGMTLRDWRYCVRIANIDTSDLATYGGGSDQSTNLIHRLVEAYNKLHMIGGRQIIYCNRTVLSALDKMVVDKSNLALGMTEWAGMKIPAFRGIPIRVCDAILNTESAVT